MENLSLRKRRPVGGRPNSRTRSRVRPGRAPCVVHSTTGRAALYSARSGRHKSCGGERKRQAGQRARGKPSPEVSARHKTYTAGGGPRASYISSTRGNAYVFRIHTTRCRQRSLAAHAFRLLPFLRSIFSVPSILQPSRLLFFHRSRPAPPSRSTRSLSSPSLPFSSSLPIAPFPFFLHFVIFSEFRYPSPQRRCAAPR